MVIHEITRCYSESWTTYESEVPAARCVHSIALALTASAPSSSPSRRSSSSHFLKKDLGDDECVFVLWATKEYSLGLVARHFEGKSAIEEVSMLDI